MDRHDEQFESYLRQFRLRKVSPLPEIVLVRYRVRTRWFLVAAAVVLVAGLSVVFFRNSGAVDGPRAVVEAAGNPSLYRVGETIESDKVIRSNSAVGLLLALEDGSRVEMHAQSELKLESAADGIRVRLNGGSIVVTAAKQGAGLLYVQTRDALVSVVGTVFLVNAEQSGTTVGVVEGEVHVQQGAELKKLLPGEQVATSPAIHLKTVAEEISWSRNATEYVVLLQQSGRVLDVRPLEAQSNPSPATPGDSNSQPAESIGKNSLALFQMAEARFEQGDINTAVQLFRDALNGDLKPKWIEVWAHINIGKIYDVRGGQRDRAVQEYQKAVNTGNDTYSAQAEAKKYIGAPFRLSGPTQQAVTVPYPSLTPPVLLAQQQQATAPPPAQSDPDRNSAGRQILDRTCTSCHDARIAMMDPGMRVSRFSSSDRLLLSNKQAELEQLLKRGLTPAHPDVMRVQADINLLTARAYDAVRSYGSFVSSHLSQRGGTIPPTDVSTLAQYLFEENGKATDPNIPSDIPLQRQDFPPRTPLVK